MNDDQRLASELQTWASRPPTLPATIAAARVRSRLERRTNPRALRWSLALALIAVVGGLVTRQAPDADDELFPVPLSPDVVVLWLDRDTPLYLTLPAAVQSPHTTSDQGAPVQ